MVPPYHELQHILTVKEIPMRKFVMVVGLLFSTFGFNNLALGAPACKSWCENIPQSVWDKVPGCEECSEANACAKWCEWIPEEQKAKVPQCASCTADSFALASCKKWCKWVPSATWPDVPQCSTCETGQTDDCAAYCRYIPEGIRENTYGCLSCQL